MKTKSKMYFVVSVLIPVSKFLSGQVTMVRLAVQVTYNY